MTHPRPNLRIVSNTATPLKVEIPMVPARGNRVVLNGADDLDLQIRAYHLHIAAIVTVYGPIPDLVRITFEPTQPAGVKAFASCPLSDAQAVDWTFAAGAGLTKWAEAQFCDPVDLDEENGQMVATLADYREVVGYALSQLRGKAIRVRRGEDYTRLFTNLSAHIERYGRCQPTYTAEDADD